jgi:leukotriene-A4 hydrolase
MTSARFLADLREHLVKGDEALEQRLMLDEWVYQPGNPIQCRKAGPERLRRSRPQAAISATQAGPAHRFSGWTTAEQLRFLNRLPRNIAPTDASRAGRASTAVNQARNNEVLFAWLEAGGRQPLRSVGSGARAVPDHPGAAQVRSAADRGAGRGPAMGAPDRCSGSTERARPLYHPITTKGLDELGLPAG